MCQLLLPRIRNNLPGVYKKIKLPNRNYIHFETWLLMRLYGLIHPKGIRPKMENRFQCSPTRISLAIKQFAKVFLKFALKFLSNFKIWKEGIPYYAELVSNKTEGVSTNDWWFIDGTMPKSCCPGRHQKIAYSGHKQHHGLKYQSIYLPDGIIAILFGPVPCSRHDSFMLSQSGVFDDLQAIIIHYNVPHHRLCYYFHSSV